MASEKQIAASRANARRSTGPRTALGKLKSSRNAFRHGLSIPLQSNYAGSEEIHALVKALVEGDTSEVKLLAANNVALVQLELPRIRKTRAVLFTDINVGLDDAQSLKRLAALDRYERTAHAKRRKAASPRGAVEHLFSTHQTGPQGHPTANSQITDAALRSVNPITDQCGNTNTQRRPAITTDCLAPKSLSSSARL